MEVVTFEEDGAIGATSGSTRRASTLGFNLFDSSSDSPSTLTGRIRASSPAVSPTNTPPETPIPSRRASPAPPGLNSPYPSSPGTRRRNPPPPSSNPLASASSPSFARRLSKPFIDIAVKASRPSIYVNFLLSVHPSLIAYFLVSVSSTISNKSLLRGFFQGITFLLTAWQMACATLGTMLSVRLGAYKPKKLVPRRETIMKIVALVFSFEIAASNLALRLVPVPFHISVRAASPILTLVLSVLFFSSRTTLRTSSSLLLVLLGISFTSLNEEWHSLGSLLTMFSTLLLSSKSLLTTHLLSNRFHLHPLDVLARMSPLSMIHCSLFSIANGEFSKLSNFVRSEDFTRNHLLEIVLNGILSFAVVVCGLVAERRTKPPALAITAQAAQATTILVSTLIFGLSMSFLNFIGVALVFAGGVFYARYEAIDDVEERNAATSPSSYRSGGIGDGSTNGGGLGGDSSLLPMKVKREDPLPSFSIGIGNGDTREEGLKSSSSWWGIDGKG